MHFQTKGRGLTTLDSQPFQVFPMVRDKPCWRAIQNFINDIERTVFKLYTHERLGTLLNVINEYISQCSVLKIIHYGAS